MQHFVLEVLDKDSVPVNTSHYRLTSLQLAAWAGHTCQKYQGFTVTITDLSEVPHKKYRIDESGEPVPV